MPHTTNHWLDLNSGMTRPQVFECSDGVDRVVKMLDLCTASSLASDWMGCLLAAHLEILTPTPSIVTVDEMSIATMPEAIRRTAKPGIAFGTTYIRLADPVFALGSILACPNHRELLSRLVTLDSWIHTEDRMRPEFGRNLLIDKEERNPLLMAIDFGMCFSEVLRPLLVPHDGTVSLVMHDGIAAIVDHREIAQALDRIESTTDADIVKMVNTTPEPWLSAEAKGKMSAYLLRTRQLVGPVIRQELGMDMLT